jgi:hypothetical protein
MYMIKVRNSETPLLPSNYVHNGMALRFKGITWVLQYLFFSCELATRQLLKCTY